MYDEEYAGPSTLKEKSEAGIRTSAPSMTFYAEGPEFAHEDDFEENSADQDMVLLQSDQVSYLVSQARPHLFTLKRML
jgi:hypothetical protein